MAQVEVEEAGYVIRPPPIGGDFSASPHVTTNVNPLFDERDKKDPSFHTRHPIAPKDLPAAAPEDKKKTAYVAFMAALGLSPHISTTPWHELSDRSQRRQSAALRLVTDFCATEMDPDDPQSLKDKTFKPPSDYERPRNEDFVQYHEETVDMRRIKYSPAKVNRAVEFLTRYG